MKAKSPTSKGKAAFATLLPTIGVVRSSTPCTTFSTTTWPAEGLSFGLPDHEANDDDEDDGHDPACNNAIGDRQGAEVKQRVRPGFNAVSFGRQNRNATG